MNCLACNKPYITMAKSWQKHQERCITKHTAEMQRATITQRQFDIARLKNGKLVAREDKNGYIGEWHLYTDLQSLLGNFF